VDFFSGFHKQGQLFVLFFKESTRKPKNLPRRIKILKQNIQSKKGRPKLLETEAQKVR